MGDGGHPALADRVDTEMNRALLGGESVGFDVAPAALFGPTECVEFLFRSTERGLGVGEDGTEQWGGHDRCAAFLTGSRLLVVSPEGRRDDYVQIPYSHVTNAEALLDGEPTVVVRYSADLDGSHSGTAHVRTDADAGTVREAAAWLTERAGGPDDGRGFETGTTRDITQDRAGAASHAGEATEHAAAEHVAEEHGAYVTPERVGKLAEVLDDGEVVHYLTRGSTVDVEGSSAGQSLFGDDRSRKSGTRGYVRAAITDRRVVVKVPQWLGNDERSVPYRTITSVDLDTGLVNKRLSLQTPGQTYHIEAHEPGKEEVREAVRFVRGKLAEANEPQVVESGPDPTEQLKNVKQLHDQGVLTDEEFERKKAELLDRI